jgi:hypothetical protein
MQSEKSKMSFIPKISITIEEADESLFWMEIMSKKQALIPSEKLIAA